MARLTVRIAMALAFGGAVAMLCAGCPNGNLFDLGPTLCDRSIAGNPPALFTQGVVSGDCYETSSWDGEWLYFPGGHHFQLEHKLGCVPLDIQSYLSFSANGPSMTLDDAGASDGGDVTDLGGDPFGIVTVNDQYIIVGNDSCVPFYVRVTACGCDPDGPHVDAGTEEPDASAK